VLEGTSSTQSLPISEVSRCPLGQENLNAGRQGLHPATGCSLANFVEFPFYALG
jgi:hypothetical protein